MIHINFHSPAELPPQEDLRQQAVERSGVLRRGGDPALQRLVDQAAELFCVPIAAISIIDRDRQFLAVRKGYHQEETPRAISFCAHAILRPGEPLLVPDARHDRRFAGNPQVIFPPHIRFYAGIPLLDRQGYPLGAFCVVDSKPRADVSDLFELSLLAREAERQIGR